MVYPFFTYNPAEYIIRYTSNQDTVRCLAVNSFALALGVRTVSCYDIEFEAITLVWLYHGTRTFVLTNAPDKFGKMVHCFLANNVHCLDVSPETEMPHTVISPPRSIGERVWAPLLPLPCVYYAIVLMYLFWRKHLR